MDLKFTFDDGSEGYLLHYGVSGMTWGHHKARQKEELNAARMRQYRQLQDKAAVQQYKPEDEEKKKKKWAKTLRNISKSLTKAAKGPEAKKAKAKVKGYFSTKKTKARKHIRARGVVIEDLGNGKSKTTYY